GPRDVHENLEAERVGGVEELPRGDVIHADRVRPQPADLAEIRLELVLDGQGDSIRLRLEGPVGDALDPELLVAEAEELAIEGDAGGLERSCTNWCSTLPQGVHALL